MKKIFKKLKNIAQNEYVLLLAILTLGFLVRLYKIDSPIADWHSWRQADTASVTRIYIQEGIDLLYPRYHDISSIQTGIYNEMGFRFVEFPIFNVIHALVATGFDQLTLETWGRLVSVFSALISGVFLYLIGKRLLGKWGGLLSAFYFLLLPFNIYFTRVILPEPMAVTFGVISLYLFMKFMDEEKDAALFLSGAFLALAMLIKPFVFFFTLPMIYLVYKKHGGTSLLKKFQPFAKLLVFVNIAFAPFFLWRIWINQYPLGIPFFTWAFNGDGIRFKPSWWRWIFGERLGHLILGSWGLVPFVFGILADKKDRIVRWFLFGMFLYVSIFATASVRHDYYQTFVIPAVSLTLAYGSLYLWKTKEFGKWITKIILAVSVLVMFITGALQVREFYRINHPEILIAGEAVDKIAPKDALVVAPYNGDTAFLYQTKRSGWPVVDTSFEKLIERGADYYVSVNFADPDVEKLRNRYEVVEETSQYIIIDLNKPL